MNELKDKLVRIYDAHHKDDYGIPFDLAVDAIWHHIINSQSEGNLFHDGLYQMRVCDTHERAEELAILASETVFEDEATIPHLSVADLFELCFSYAEKFEPFLA